MPILPHNFPTLRQIEDGDFRPSVLLLGAGMSYGLVPDPGALLKEKRAGAEGKLGLASAVPSRPSPTAMDLYDWAEAIVTQLVARGEPNSKLTLALSLDIPIESRWLGCVRTQRNTPRHRVIARFAREGLWDQIWSLNWDCVQESALENVGIKRDGPDTPLQWPTAFRTFVTAQDCAGMGEQYKVKVVKPHGCVMKLVEAEAALNNGDLALSIELSTRFLITKSELDNLPPAAGRNGTEHFIFANLSSKLHTQPFIVAGWSASERYVLDHFEADVRPVLEARSPLATDELSVIDILFNDQGHTRLAGFYDKERATAHISVTTTDFDTDQLFLWLQALYALERLELSATDADKAALEELTTEIQQPPATPKFVIDWVDNFLPVWVRLCWRCGLIICYDRNNQPLDVEDIELESRDEHIPWSLSAIGRPELAAAARLLAALHRSGNAGQWSFQEFPGGLYRDNHLVIPLPAWYPDTTRPNDLQGLKALVDSIKEYGDGYVERISVLLLGDPGGVIPETTKLVLKELVARDVALARFAKGSDIGEVELEAL